MEFEKGKVELSVIMPVYNEEDIILNSVSTTLKVLNSSDLSYELIIVDDGSEDRTTQLLKDFKNEAIILSYKINKGKGFALRYGSKDAHGEVIVFFDSDLNIDPLQIIANYRKFREQNLDVLVGSKRMKESVVESPFKRRFLSLVYHLFTKALLGLEVMDTQVGLKFYKKEVLESVLPFSSVDRFAYDVELLGIATKLGYRISEFPISMDMNNVNSHVDFTSIERMFVDTLKIVYKLKFSSVIETNYNSTPKMNHGRTELK